MIYANHFRSAHYCWFWLFLFWQLHVARIALDRTFGGRGRWAAAGFNCGWHQHLVSSPSSSSSLSRWPLITFSILTPTCSPHTHQTPPCDFNFNSNLSHNIPILSACWPYRSEPNLTTCCCITRKCIRNLIWPYLWDLLFCAERSLGLFKMIRWPINNWSKQCQRNEFECEVGRNMAINQWRAAFNLA